MGRTLCLRLVVIHIVVGFGGWLGIGLLFPSVVPPQWWTAVPLAIALPTGVFLLGVLPQWSRNRKTLTPWGVGADQWRALQAFDVGPAEGFPQHRSLRLYKGRGRSSCLVLPDEERRAKAIVGLVARKLRPLSEHEDADDLVTPIPDLPGWYALSLVVLGVTWAVALAVGVYALRGVVDVDTGKTLAFGLPFVSPVWWMAWRVARRPDLRRGRDRVWVAAAAMAFAGMLIGAAAFALLTTLWP